jgi:hypothetical protein
VQGKTSVQFGVISIAVFTVIMLTLAIMPQTALQTQTDGLRQAVDEASRRHNQVLGLLAGPTVTVAGELPPTFKKGSEGDIAVLDARQQNTVVPDRLDEIQKDIKTAVDGAPEACPDAKAAAYLLMGQVQVAKAQYHLQSAKNASLQAVQAIVDIDTGILSIQKRLVNIKQIEPLTQTQEEATAKASEMKSGAQTKVAELQTAIAAQSTLITKLKIKRSGHLTTATKYSNDAGELRTLSAVAQREKQRELQEQSFAKEKLSNKAVVDAEVSQAKIDTANSAVAVMEIKLTSAQGAIVAATEVLKGFAGNRAAAKSELDKERRAMDTTCQEVAKNAGVLITICHKVDSEQASATQRYADALAMMTLLRKHASPSDAGAISSEAGILMGDAWASLEVVSLRQTVAATNARLKALWVTAELKGSSPESDKMAVFADKAKDSKDAAAKSYASAAALYEEATSNADRFKWNYMCRELQARRARHQLTGDADDQTRAELLKQQLEEMKGFPYVDNAL